MTRWQLQQAKNRLSEVVKKAVDEGPQMITLRGSDAAVVIAAKEFARLQRKPKKDFVLFLRSSPLGGIALDVTRSRDTGRLVKL